MKKTNIWADVWFASQSHADKMEIWAPPTIPSALHFITGNNPLASTLNKAILKCLTTSQLFSFQWTCLSIWTRLTYYQLKKNKAIIAQNAGFTYSCIFEMFKDLTLFIRWTWPIRPSSDPVSHLLKYYPVLRKTAKGNFTSNNLRHFFFSALCSPLHHSLDGISDQCFQKFIWEVATRGDGWDSAVHTLRGHETGLFQWSIIFCSFCFWQEFVCDEMLFSLLLFLLLLQVRYLIWIRFTKNGTQFPRVLLINSPSPVNQSLWRVNN